jgi:2-polyprenyl-6-methoxyphenol hydroxylase-like FAD-dependent oxidoreductase
MSQQYSDVIVVGGGFAGSSLAISLAQAGVRVLLLEAETAFRDRVRGEVLFPWGVAETQRLGIHDLLHSAGATPLPYRDTYVGGVLRKRSAFAEESDLHGSPLTFNHAAVQETLINAARDSGVEVIRGADVQDLRPGAKPGVTYAVDGLRQDAHARLVVGADGRTSRVRRLAGFEVNRGAPGLMTAGVALKGVSTPEDGLAAAFNVRERESAALLPQVGGRVRAYLTFQERPGLARVATLDQLTERMVAAGLPPDALASASAVGPLATFDGTPKWVEMPYRDGVALIGDAASTSDPAFGQGMALALRDVRVLANALVETGNSEEVGHYYAKEHAAYSAANRFVSGILGEAQFHEGECADQLRSSDLWRRSAGRLRAIHLDGPDGTLRDLLGARDAFLSSAPSDDSAAIAC